MFIKICYFNSLKSCKPKLRWVTLEKWVKGEYTCCCLLIFLQGNSRLTHPIIRPCKHGTARITWLWSKDKTKEILDLFRVGKQTALVILILMCVLYLQIDIKNCLVVIFPLCVSIFMQDVLRMIALTVKIKWALFVGDYIIIQTTLHCECATMCDSFSTLNCQFNSLLLFHAVLCNKSRVLKPPQIHSYRKMFSHRHGSNCRINFKLIFHMALLIKSVRIAYKDHRQYTFWRTKWHFCRTWAGQSSNLKIDLLLWIVAIVSRVSQAVKKIYQYCAIHSS